MRTNTLTAVRGRKLMRCYCKGLAFAKLRHRPPTYRELAALVGCSVSCAWHLVEWHIKAGNVSLDEHKEGCVFFDRPIQEVRETIVQAVGKRVDRSAAQVNAGR